MPDITNASDTDIKKFLKGVTEKSGFSFENKVANALSSEFSISREVPYFDKDENKGRTYDILARQFFPDDDKLDPNKIKCLAQINLVIECKDVSGDIWVFSSDTSPGISVPAYASMNYDKKDPAMNIIPIDPIKNIPYVSSYSEYVYDEGRSNKQKNLYSAIHSITKAVRHQRNFLQNTMEKIKIWTPASQKYILHFAFFQPVIVFSGKLYTVNDIGDGKPDFEEQKYVQRKMGYVSKGYDESSGDIHIVSFDHLSDYIMKVKQYYREKENLIITNQDRFYDALKTVMPNLNTDNKIT